jgi:hypothetical protein
MDFVDLENSKRPSSYFHLDIRLISFLPPYVRRSGQAPAAARVHDLPQACDRVTSSPTQSRVPVRRRRGRYPHRRARLRQLSRVASEPVHVLSDPVMREPYDQQGETIAPPP